MPRTLNVETKKLAGQKARVSGWVNSWRAHGKILFVDLRIKAAYYRLFLLRKTNLFINWRKP